MPLEQLQRLLPTLTPDEFAGTKLANTKLAMAITPYYFNLIDASDEECPVRRQVVPRLGRLISGHRSAYTYLPLSVDHFLTPREFTAHLVGLGFEVTEVRMLMFGTVALHVAEQPA